MRFRSALTAMLLVTAAACSGADYGDPGPSQKYFEYTEAWSSSPTVIVVVVDDRTLPGAAALRDGVGAAVRMLGWDLINDSAARLRDSASWRSVDIRMVLVPASADTMDAVVSPATDEGLAWTAARATVEGVSEFGRAVGARVEALAQTPEGTPFRPLVWAHRVAEILARVRAPEGQAEEQLATITTGDALPTIGVTILASSDDQSAEPVEDYWSGFPLEVVSGLVTPESSSQIGLDASAYPRLVEAMKARLGAPIAGCYSDTDSTAPFLLFPKLCVDYQLRCDGRPVLQRSPGLGACNVRVTTSEPAECDASRGWVDPEDIDGVRRPTWDGKGRVCDVMPVEASIMDRCVHDAECADCASGWCVTEVQWPELCPSGNPRPIRLVGRARPDRGHVIVRCLEP